MLPEHSTPKSVKNTQYLHLTHSHIMTIESKPLLILQMMAFTSLLKDLKLERKSMPLKCIDDHNRLNQINNNIIKADMMLDVVTNELKTKHNHG